MKMTHDDKLENIRRMLINDGINFTLVMKMSDEELVQANEFDDYKDYNRYMAYLAHKYDI